MTWGNGTTGISGTVSAANSLVGTTEGDGVGGGGVTALTNGNYVVRSHYWDNGALVHAGAVTFGSGTTGVVGAINVINSDRGLVANANPQLPVLDNVNNHFITRWAGEGKVRLGSQVDGFAGMGVIVVPGASTWVYATADNAQATVGFTAPASDGGSPITSYRVTASPGGAQTTGAGSPITMMGLTNEVAYTFTVAATNEAGTGAESGASAAVTPLSPLMNWRLTYFGTSSNTGSAADDADPYQTGIQNLAVFAFLGPYQDPALAVISQLPQLEMSGGNVGFSFTEPYGVSGITYGAQWRPALDSGSWQPVTDTGSDNMHTFSVPMSGNPAVFMRLTVTSAP